MNTEAETAVGIVEELSKKKSQTNFSKTYLRKNNKKGD